MSLAENTVRLAMHPADQFEAFAELIESGQQPAGQVALRFGVEESLVLKRMKLARVAPELRQAYRDDDISLECLMAFTITDDRGKQLQVYEALEEWHGARDIRDMLTGEMAEAKSKLARFVGLDAYHAAGGVSRADLFGDQVYLENPDLLDQLAADKLDGVRQELEAEGWAWVEVSPERDWSFIGQCGRIRPVPMHVPQELIDLGRRTQVEAELEEIGQAAGGYTDVDDPGLIDAQEAAEARLAEVEEQIRILLRGLRPGGHAIRRLLRLDRPRRRAFGRRGPRPARAQEAAGKDGRTAGLGRNLDPERQPAAGNAAPRPRSLPAPGGPGRDGKAPGYRHRPAGVSRRLRRVRSRVPARRCRCPVPAEPPEAERRW